MHQKHRPIGTKQVVGEPTERISGARSPHTAGQEHLHARSPNTHRRIRGEGGCGAVLVSGVEVMEADHAGHR